MTQIRIGIPDSSPAGWYSILAQEGVPFICGLDTFDTNDYSVIIAGDSASDQFLGALRSYLSGGGAVLFSGEAFGRMAGVECVRKRIGYYYGEVDSLFPESGILDLYTECMIHPQANHLKAQDGSFGIFMGEYNGGYVAVLPFDAGEVSGDSRVMAKSFYSRNSRLPHERVSATAKGEIRKLVSRCLEILHQRRSLPYIHKWYYPNDSQTVFGLRIDTDYSTINDLRKLYTTLHTHKIPATWFIDVGSQQQCLSFFKEMENQEAALHCYKHVTYPDYDLNLKNIQDAQALLNKSIIRPKGFAAPFGIWNEGLTRAVADSGFEYSSEFSYDYDNLPSYPVINNTLSSVLQVPVHPICIGSLRRQGFTESEMIDYFKMQMDWKYESRDPMIFYHHPKDDNHPVLDSIFHSLKEYSVVPLHMYDYARWWRSSRLRMKFDVRYEHEELKIAMQSAPGECMVRIKRNDAQQIIVRPQQTFQLDRLSWDVRKKGSGLPQDFQRTRRWNPWIAINNIEDRLKRWIG